MVMIVEEPAVELGFAQCGLNGREIHPAILCRAMRGEGQREDRGAGARFQGWGEKSGKVKTERQSENQF
jgi:hypothetical protein